MAEAKMSDIIRTSLEGVKEFAEKDTFIGDVIVTPTGVSIIPVSRVNIGFATGGVDYAGKRIPPTQNFGGGGGTEDYATTEYVDNAVSSVQQTATAAQQSAVAAGQLAQTANNTATAAQNEIDALTTDVTAIKVVASLPSNPVAKTLYLILN